MSLSQQERNELLGDVLAEVDRLEPELVSLCRDLVRINTVNPYSGGRVRGCEKPGQEYLKPILEEMGGTCRLFEPPPDVYRRFGVCAPRDRAWNDRPNLATTFEFGPGPRIILNSHMDTVGVDGMAFDPFSAELRDGVIYGRGSSDDKGGMAAGITAIKALLPFREQLRGTIVHESVVDEESSGSGAGTLACILAGYTGDEALVIDGSGLEVIRGCGGCLTAEVTVHGRSGHAAHGGVNAIEKGLRIAEAIRRFKAERQAEVPENLVNLGTFYAGEHPAVVPARARLGLNIVYGIAEAAENERTRGKWNGDAVRARFAETLRAAEAGDPWLAEHPSDIDWIKDLVPFETPAEAAPVRRLLAAGRAALGRKLEVGIMAAWADAANLARYGGVPSVLFGVGTPGKAHAADETARVRDLVEGARVIAAYLCFALT